MPRYRNEVLYIRLTKEEKNNLLEKMKLAGMTNMGEFVRTILSYNPVVKLDTEGLRQLAYQVEKLGININQIAKHANQSGSLYENDIKDIQDKMNSLNVIVEELYSALKNKKRGGI